MCNVTGSNLLKFMESFSFFSAPECFKKYIIDGSCFVASQKNYDDTISPRKKEKLGEIKEKATSLVRHIYGGKLTKKHSKRSRRTKQFKQSKRSKQSKRKYTKKNLNTKNN